MTDRALTVEEITQDKIDLLKACEDAARICGLEAMHASLNNDTSYQKAWCEVQHLLDAAIKKANRGKEYWRPAAQHMKERNAKGWEP